MTIVLLPNFLCVVKIGHERSYAPLSHSDSRRSPPHPQMSDASDAEFFVVGHGRDDAFHPPPLSLSSSSYSSDGISEGESGLETVSLDDSGAASFHLDYLTMMRHTRSYRSDPVMLRLQAENARLRWRVRVLNAIAGLRYCPIVFFSVVAIQAHYRGHRTRRARRDFAVFLAEYEAALEAVLSGLKDIRTRRERLFRICALLPSQTNHAEDA